MKREAEKSRLFTGRVKRRKRERGRVTALCSIGLVNTTPAFLFVLFASILPRFKSRVALSRGQENTAKCSLEKTRRVHRLVPRRPLCIPDASERRG